MTSFFPKNEVEFNKWLVEEYFRCGTVDEVFRKYKFNIPISYASYQRILDKWEVIKSVGADNKLTEVLEFIEHLAKDNISFEDVYRKIPLRFQTSVSTLYRVLGYMKEGITRRVGAGLIVTPYNSKKKVLLAEDISTPRIELGKPYKAVSLPMGYARKRDSRRTNVLRILQHEVFTGLVVEREFPASIMPAILEPFMYLDIADVRVAIYHIQLARNLSKSSIFKSFKLINYHFQSIGEILSGKEKYRVGVREAVWGYKRYLSLINRNLTANPIQAKSILNKNLAAITLDLEV